MPDRSAFFDFLQERWALFINSQFGGEWSESKVAESAVLKYPGATIIPFDHDDIRVYIDNLFTETGFRALYHIIYLLYIARYGSWFSVPYWSAIYWQFWDE